MSHEFSAIPFSCDAYESCRLRRFYSSRFQRLEVGLLPFIPLRSACSARIVTHKDIMKPSKNINPFLRTTTLGLFVAAVMMSCPQHARAANLTWDIATGDGAAITPGNGSWDTTAGNLKWNNGTTNTAWTAANAAIFGGGDGTHGITLGSSFAAQAVTFNSSGYTLGATSAQTLSLTNTSGNLITVSTGKSATLGNNVTVALNANANTSTTISLAATTGNDSTLNIDSGATLTKNGAGGTGQLQFTTGNASTNGIVNVAGTVKYEVTSGTAAIVIGQTSGTTTMNVNSGGLVTTNSTGAAASSGSIILSNNGAAAVLNVAGGGAVTLSNTSSTSGLNIARLAGGNGTVNLNGGTITTPRVFKGVIGTPGTSTGIFNFNGGTLTANATNNTDFMSGLTTANVRDGGAKIDTGIFSITIAQALLHSNIAAINPVTGTPDAAIDGGVTKSGSGVLALSGANTYTGATAVNSGTLNLTGSLTSAVNVANGATITGTGSTTGLLTMSGGSTFAASTSGVGFTASGVAFTGATNLIFDGATTNGSTYDLFNYGAGGVSGLSNLTSSFRTTFTDTGSKITGTVSTGTRTWNTTSGVWESGGATTNWLEGDQKYFNGDTVTFGNPASGSIVTLNGSLLPGGAVSVNNANAYTFSGGGSIGGSSGLTKDGEGILNIATANTYSGGTNINAGTVSLSGSGTLGASTGAVVLSGGALDLGSTGQTVGAVSITAAAATGDTIKNGTLTSATFTASNTGGNAIVSGIIAGSSSVTMSGSGTLTLAGANSYTGATSVKNGTLTLSATGSVANSASLTLGDGTTNTSGVLQLGDASGAGTASFGSLAVAGSGLGNAVVGGGASVSTLTINTASTSTFSGVLGGAGTNQNNLGLTKSGAGNLILSNTSNSYSGQTIINGTGSAGILQIGANEVIPNASEVVISNGGKFVVGVGTATPGSYTETIRGLSGPASASSLVEAFDAGTGGTGYIGNLIIDTAGGSFDFGGFVRDRGGSVMTITKNGAGTQILSGANSYSGATTINGGTLQIGNGGTTGSLTTTAIVNNSTLAFNRSNGLTLGNVISGTGGITQAGAGTTTLSGANSYTGVTKISQGTLSVTTIGDGGAAGGNLGSATNAAGNIVFDGGTLQYTGLTATTDRSFTINTGKTATIEITANNLTVAGASTSTNGALTKAGSGTLTLSGGNLHTGATTINTGTLALDAAGTIDASSGVVLGTAGTFDVSAKGAAGYAVTSLTGSGSVVGSLTVSTQLAIGSSPGIMNFGGSLTLGSTSTFLAEVTGGSAPSVGSADIGNVAGDLTIDVGSILDLVQLGTYTAGNKFTLFGYTGTLAGNFNDVSSTVINDGDIFTDAGGEWMIDYNDVSPGANGGSGNSFITVTAVPEAGPAAVLGAFGMIALLRRRRPC